MSLNNYKVGLLLQSNLQMTKNWQVTHLYFVNNVFWEHEFVSQHTISGRKNCKGDEDHLLFFKQPSLQYHFVEQAVGIYTYSTNNFKPQKSNNSSASSPCCRLESDSAG